MSQYRAPGDTVSESNQIRLGRIQMSLPLALSVLATATLLGVFVAHPSMAEISEQWLTILTPSSSLIGIYWLVLFALLVGQSILLITHRKAETEALLINGVGIRMPLVIFLFSAWTLFWCLHLFLVAEIILLVAFLGALSMWATCLRYPPNRSAPFDFLLVHTPVRMLLCVIFSVDIWHNGLLALGYFREHDDTGKGHWETEHSLHSWIAFGVVLGVAVINSSVVFFTRDVVWAACTIYLSIALAVHADGKPAQIEIVSILGAALILVSLLSSIGWQMLKEDRERAIALPEDAEEV